MARIEKAVNIYREELTKKNPVSILTVLLKSMQEPVLTGVLKNPVTKNITCHTFKPSKEEIEILKQKLENKKSASIKIKSQIIENDEVCVDFLGYYVIKL